MCFQTFVPWFFGGNLFAQPWIGWAFGLTLPNPGYGELSAAELQQPMDDCTFAPTSPNPENDEFSTAELHLHQTPKSSMGGVTLLCLTDHI